MLRRLAVVLPLSLLLGCASTMPVAQYAFPPTPDMSSVEKAASCMQEAHRQCTPGSIRCDAFGRTFTRACMLEAGVPPDEIMVLTSP